MVEVVILTRTSRASSKLLVFAKSVVTCKSISENPQVLLEFEPPELFESFCFLSSMCLFQFGSKFDDGSCNSLNSIVFNCFALYAFVKMPLLINFVSQCVDHPLEMVDFVLMGGRPIVPLPVL